ncbi:MAG: hypothetical protein NVS3B29_08260 [Candidatus Saccharimonadales bacterium]
MLVLETGIVRRFYKTTKKFGFASVLNVDGRETDEELFFHLDQDFGLE